MMNPLIWKIGSFVVIIGLIFFAGDNYRKKVDQAAQLASLQEALKQAADKQKTVDATAKQLETDLAAERVKTKQLAHQWEAYRAKPHSNCNLDPDALSVLKQATAGDKAGHPGQPDR